MTPAYRDVKVGAPLSEQEQKVIDLRNSGANDQVIADRLGYANANAAGNARRRAETKLGERSAESETPSRSGRSTAKVEVPSFLTGVVDVFQRIVTVEQETAERIEQLETAADATDEDIFNAERDRLQAEVDRAMAALNAHVEMPDDNAAKWIEGQRNAAVARIHNADGSDTQSFKDLKAAHEKASSEREEAENMLRSAGVDVDALLTPEMDEGDEGDDTQPDEGEGTQPEPAAAPSEG